MMFRLFIGLSTLAIIQTLYGIEASFFVFIIVIYSFAPLINQFKWIKYKE